MLCDIFYLRDKHEKSGSNYIGIYYVWFHVMLHKGTIKIDDFVMQEGDKVFLTDANFSWDM